MFNTFCLQFGFVVELTGACCNDWVSCKKSSLRD